MRAQRLIVVDMEIVKYTLIPANFHTKTMRTHFICAREYTHFIRSLSLSLPLRASQYTFSQFHPFPMAIAESAVPFATSNENIPFTPTQNRSDTHAHTLAHTQRCHRSEHSDLGCVDTVWILVEIVYRALTHKQWRLSNRTRSHSKYVKINDKQVTSTVYTLSHTQTHALALWQRPTNTIAAKHNAKHRSVHVHIPHPLTRTHVPSDDTLSVSVCECARCIFHSE